MAATLMRGTGGPQVRRVRGNQATGLDTQANQGGAQGSLATGRTQNATGLPVAKERCGSRGTVRESAIEIQGDHRDVIVADLIEEGWPAKKSDGQTAHETRRREFYTLQVLLDFFWIATVYRRLDLLCQLLNFTEFCTVRPL
jgi:hypothetical protein